MGKAGKERKRRKLENHHSIGVDNEDVEHSDSDGEVVDQQQDDLSIAIHALDILGQRIDLYRSKAMKGVRSALFPLIEIQIKKSAFFEGKSTSINQETAEITLTSSLDSLVRTASMLSSDMTRFLSFEMKEFRHALHPLVQVTQQKEKQNEPSQPTISPNNNMSIPTYTEQSYAQRISSLFRANQWTQALIALHAMRTESQERPKLGTIQRWVRECDLVRVSGESGCENLSWLLLDATMRLQDLAKSGDHHHGSCSSSSGSGSTHGSIHGGVAGSQHKGSDKQQQDKGLHASEWIPHTAVVTRHPVFRSHHINTLTPIPTPSITIPTPTPSITIPTNSSTIYTTEYIQSRVSVLSHVPGPQRRPPSSNDLNIYQLAPHTMIFDHEGAVAGAAAAAAAVMSLSSASASSSSASSSSPSSSKPSIHNPFRTDIPHLPSVFLMENILTPNDCQRLIALAEGIGYVPDAAEGIDNLQLYADDTLLQPIFQRCRGLLPPTIGRPECRLVGLNARWRLFRYYQEAVYRPHIDGSWPGSGIDPSTGTFVEDIYEGKCVSKLTCLIYLNGARARARVTTAVRDNSSSSSCGDDGSSGGNTGSGNSSNGSKIDEKVDHDDDDDAADFDGGHTTFYQPNPAILGHIDARGVQPTTGAILCFPHGEIGSLVHEGSAVVGNARGAKYVIRTDVIYEC